jgi:hypothetical protein
MRRVLREPLLHFLILGVLLFAIYGALHGDALRSSHEIIVDQARVATLATQFQRVWQRSPTPPELQSLIDNWAREEILYREGLAAGMDRDDEVVRRRVVQKMLFEADAMAADVPSEADLEDWLRKHPDEYRIAPYYTLHQVYFDPHRHSDELERVTGLALAALERDQQAQVGDASMLPASLVDADTVDIARVFGESFAAALPQLPTGRWTGPVVSGFGVHLVLIDSRTPARAPALAEVRKAVERDLLNARTQDAKDEFYRAMSKRYTVKIELDAAKVGNVPTQQVSMRDTPQQAE